MIRRNFFIAIFEKPLFPNFYVLILEKVSNNEISVLLIEVSLLCGKTATISGVFIAFERWRCESSIKLIESFHYDLMNEGVIIINSKT
jgi:hypothetical protein